MACVDRGGAGDLVGRERAERRDGERRDRLGLGNGADGERRTRRPEGREGDHGQCTERSPGTAMHHPGGPSATHKVSIPVAGRDRRPQSVCAPTPQWRGWRRVGLDAAVFGACLPSVTGQRRRSPTNAPRPPPGSTGSPAPHRSNPTPGCPTRPVRTCGSSAKTCRSDARTSCAARTTCSPSSARRSGRPARCARAPATTARASPTPADGSGCAGACTCRAPHRARSASGSPRWVATTSS